MPISIRELPVGYSIEELYDDLHHVNQMLWLYDLTIANGHPKSSDGTIDYVERREKMLEIKRNIFKWLAVKGEISNVQLCE